MKKTGKTTKSSTLIDLDDLDAAAAEEAKSAADSLDEASGTDEAAAERPKRKRGRPRKMRIDRSEQPVKRKTMAKKKTAKSKPTSPEESVKVTTPVTQPYKEPPRKKIPTSIFNLFLFAVIFGLLIGAQYYMEWEKKKETNLNVSTVEITPEVDLNGELTETAKAEGEEVEAASETETKEVKVVETVEVGTIKKADEKAEIPGTISETVTKTPRPKEYTNYYQPDPYTNGSSLDLDGPNARKRYMKENRVYTKKTRTTRPRYYKESSYDYQYVEREPIRAYRPRDYEESSYKYKWDDGDSRVRYTEKRTVVEPDIRYTDAELEATRKTQYNSNSSSYRSGTYEKGSERPYMEKYSDRSNPWNSGGVHDLDYPGNQPSSMITRRSRDY